MSKQTPFFHRCLAGALVGLVMMSNPLGWISSAEARPTGSLHAIHSSQRLPLPTHQAPHLLKKSLRQKKKNAAPPSQALPKSSNKSTDQITASELGLPPAQPNPSIRIQNGRMILGLSQTDLPSKNEALTPEPVEKDPAQTPSSPTEDSQIASHITVPTLPQLPVSPLKTVPQTPLNSSKNPVMGSQKQQLSTLNHPILQGSTGKMVLQLSPSPEKNPNKPVDLSQHQPRQARYSLLPSTDPSEGTSTLEIEAEPTKLNRSPVAPEKLIPKTYSAMTQEPESTSSFTLQAIEATVEDTPAEDIMAENDETLGESTDDLSEWAAGITNAPTHVEISRSFDYGTYYKMTHDLYKYKDKVQEAKELAQDLYLPVPEETINQLFNESHQYKGEFESLYLAGRVEEAFKKYEIARRKILQALFLVSPSTQVEGRAIWLDRGSIVACESEAAFRQLITDLHEAGFNIIFLETVNAGYAIYPSRYLEKNPLVNGWDPVQVAIDQGHQYGMEIHAWVWVFAVGNKRHNPIVNKPEDYPGPILSNTAYHSEAMRTAGGGLVPARQTEFWLSPASPQARQLLKNVFLEIVQSYDVDGLQLDYIRYPFQHARAQVGYESIGKNRFQRETGISLPVNPQGHTRRVWSAWKTYQVSSFVKEVSELLKGVKPQLQISAAVFPMTRAGRLLSIHQDWETWVQKGWVDILTPMSYTSSPERLARVMNRVKLATQDKVVVYPGIGIHRIDAADMLDQLNVLRYEVGAMGSTLFAMAHLGEAKQELLKQGPYRRSPAVLPHRDPLQGLAQLVQDYQLHFQRVRAGLRQEAVATSSKSLAPSHHPVLEAFSTAESEGNQFQAVADIDIRLPVIPTVDYDAMEEALNSLQALLPKRQPTHSPLNTSLNSSIRPTEVVPQIKPRLDSLRNASDLWFRADGSKHPLRSQYFDYLLNRMEWLYDYSVQKLKASVSITSEPFLFEFSLETPEVSPVASRFTGLTLIDPAGPTTLQPSPRHPTP